MPHSTPRSAFTLVELLVVVAIIVALLAILMPSVSGAIATAHLAACQSNLHQIGLATTSYTSDHFTIYPSRSYQINTTTGGASSFATLGKNGSTAYFNTGDNNIVNRELNAYLGGPFKNTDDVPVAQCPQDTASGATGYYNSSGSSYRLNSHHLPATRTLYNSHRVSEVRSPSRFVVYHEAESVSVYTQFAAPVAWAYWHRPYPEPYFTHAFADGHAALVEVVPLYAATSDYSYLIDE